MCYAGASIAPSVNDAFCNSVYLQKIHEVNPVSSCFIRISKFPFYFHLIYDFLLNLHLFFPPIWTMMSLCFVLYTYWTPLVLSLSRQTH